MDELNISRSILSVTAPGTHIVPGDDALARKVTREANEYVASVVQAHPMRLGFFASLPLPDVEGSLEEIEYVVSQNLDPAGFCLVANNHGIYLGDSRFDRVFDRLNEISANVFIHPTNCRVSLSSSSSSADGGGVQKHCDPLPDLPGAVLEYFFETARAVTNLLVSATVARCPNVTFIVPHCGSVLPSVLERVSGFATQCLGLQGIPTSHQVKDLFHRQFYFDLAGYVLPDQLPAMLRLTSADRLLYGSDLPFPPVPVARRLAESLDEYLNANFSQKVIAQIYNGNAANLFGKRQD
jgi:predicted TIM-barrel fold metal-dependent hydrolase